MNELHALLSSPRFWFATVFIAFLMSLAASYAKDGIARVLATVSTRRRATLANKDKTIEREAAELSKVLHHQVLYRLDIVYLKQRQVIYIIVVYMAMFLALQSALMDRYEVGIALLAFAFCFHSF